VRCGLPAAAGEAHHRHMVVPEHVASEGDGEGDGLNEEAHRVLQLEALEPIVLLATCDVAERAPAGGDVVACLHHTQCTRRGE
jgi:hypothetical protein